MEQKAGTRDPEQEDPLDAARSLFRRVRPLCVQVMDATASPHEPYGEDGTRLYEALCAVHTIVSSHDVSSTALRHCADYILFPMLHLLRRTVGLIDTSTTKAGAPWTAVGTGIRTETCLRIVAAVLRGSGDATTDSFAEIFFLVSLVLTEQERKGSTAAFGSEEVKQAAVDAAAALLEAHRTEKVREVLAAQPLRLSVAGALAALVQFIRDEKCRDLRIGAMRTVGSLYEAIGNPDVLANYFPGVISALARVALGDQKQGQGVLSTALDVLGMLTVALMRDDQESFREHSLSSFESLRERIQGDARSHQTKGLSSPPSIEEDGLPCVIRNAEWIANTASHLCALLSRLSSLVSHPRFRVRRSLSHLAGSLCTECCHTLRGAVPALVDALVTLSDDDNEEVAAVAQHSLHKASTSIAAHNMDVSELLEERLLRGFSNLPKTMHSTDEAAKVAALRLLIGYASLLGPRLDTVLVSSCHRVCLGLLQAAEFERAGSIYPLSYTSPLKPRVVEHHPLGTTRVGIGQYPVKVFRHALGTEVPCALERLCHVLGRRCGSISALVDQLLGVAVRREQRESSGVLRKEAIFLCNEMIRGSLEGSRDDLLDSVVRSVARLMLGEYLSPELFDLTTSARDGTISLETASDNTLVVALILEGVGCIARVMGTSFRKHLLTTIYPMLERMGDATEVVSSAACCAVEEIRCACGYSSVTDLIACNVDYIVDATCHRFRFLELNPRVLEMMQGFLLHAGAVATSFLDDMLESLFDALDRHRVGPRYLGGFFRVLLLMTVAVGRAVDARDMHQQEEEEEEEEEEEKRKEDKVTQEEEMLLRILAKMEHFGGAADTNVRLNVLEIILQGCHFLRHTTRQLLPIAARLWPLVLLRIRDKEVPIAVKALEVVTGLSEDCGDFLAHRVRTEFWPVVRSLVEPTAPPRRGLALVGTVKLKGMISTSSSSPSELDANYEGMPLPRHRHFPVAAARCLEHFAGQDALRPLVAEIGKTFCFLLHTRENSIVRSSVLSMLKCVGELDRHALREAMKATLRDPLESQETKDLFGFLE